MPAQLPSQRKTSKSVLALIRRAGMLLVICAACLRSSFVLSNEYALIIGGGPNPSRNPVSLETQVLQAIDVLKARKLKRIDVLFADGDSPEVDLVDHAAEPPKKISDQAKEAEEYLQLLYDTKPLEEEPTRNHRVPHVDGAATAENVRQWFKHQGTELKRGDHLLLYFATHGGRTTEEEGKSPESEVLLWNGGRLTATDLHSLIRQLPTGVRVTLLITGCYSGGFGEPTTLHHFNAKEEEPRTVAGFFSSLPDRPAAGCTPQAFSPESRDYATCFWAAQAGHWPDGAKLTSNPDLNEDGKVTFAEAHAFALVEDNTLDTPLKRSDIVLRKISRYGKIEETRLLMEDAPYEDILDTAKPLDAHVLEQLSQKLKLIGQRRISKARRELKSLAEEDIPFYLKLRAMDLEGLASLRSATLAKLKTKYPAWTEDDYQLIVKSQASFPAGFVRYLSNSTELDELRDITYSLRSIDTRRLELETTWAKYWRFINVAESVILAHNLRELEGSSEDWKAFQQLQAAEDDF